MSLVLSKSGCEGDCALGVGICSNGRESEGCFRLGSEKTHEHGRTLASADLEFNGNQSVFPYAWGLDENFTPRFECLNGCWFYCWLTKSLCENHPLLVRKKKFKSLYFFEMLCWIINTCWIVKFKLSLFNIS